MITFKMLLALVSEYYSQSLFMSRFTINNVYLAIIILETTCTSVINGNMNRTVLLNKNVKFIPC